MVFWGTGKREKGRGEREEREEREKSERFLVFTITLVQ